ncbi:MAG TPA: glycine oxidase ThiO [Kiloniellales bacterium]|jgi:glycine oxidase
MATPVFSSSATPKGRVRPRVAVIGGGVCGLGIAWRLAQAGCAVELFERGEAGHGATWAAAGMLAAGAEAEPGEQSLLELTRLSQAAWPAFAQELEATTGLDLGYRDEGILVVALTHDDVEQLRFTYEFQRSLGIDLHWLTGAEARAREPHLRPGIAAAVHSPGDHQVDNRQLALALKQAAVGAGGRLHEHCPVASLIVEGGKARGVRLADGTVVAADAVVLAAGAWSREIEGLPPAVLPPVRPVKGQMLALQMDPAAPLLSHVLWAPKAYLVPRNDGRLLIGATVEERGFDETLTAGGLLALLEGAWRVLPGIEELPIAETWVGFRPTSRDDAPILGATAVDGLVVATGHHRNGILLAPVTAEAVAAYILTGEMPAAVVPFDATRFAAAPARQAAGGAV